MSVQYWQVRISLPEMTEDRRACPCSQVTLGPRGTLGATSEEWVTVCQLVEVEMQSTHVLSASWCEMPRGKQRSRPNWLHSCVCLWSRVRLGCSLQQWCWGTGRPQEEGVIWPSRLRSVMPLRLLRLEEETK